MENDFRGLGHKLDLLIGLVAGILIKDKPSGESIVILSRAGLAPKEIAKFIGTTSLTVRVTLSTSRKNGQKKKTKKRK